MNCYFTLMRDQIEFADKASWGRYSARLADGLAAVGHRAGDDALWSHIRGGRFECALYLWVGGKRAGARWNCDVHEHWTVELAKLPDVTVPWSPIGWDAKLQPETGNWAENGEHIVRCGQVNPAHIYVFGSAARHPLYVFHGYMVGERVAACPVGGREDHPGHVVKVADLLDCMALKNGSYKD